MLKNILITIVLLLCTQAKAGTPNATGKLQNDTKLILLRANKSIMKMDITNATRLIILAEKRNPSLVKETGIKERLKLLKEFTDMCRKINIKPEINEATEKLWEKQSYKDALLLYKVHKELNLKLKQSNIIKLAMALAWSNHLKEAEDILEEYKNKKDRNYIELKLKICNWAGNYDCSKKYMNLLLKYYPDGQSYKLAFETLLNYGELEKAEQLLLVAKRKFPGNTWKELFKKIEEKREKLIKQLMNAYSKNPTWKNCLQLTYLLYTSGKKEEAIKLLKSYLQKHPNSEEALVTLAKYLSWSGKLDEAEELYDRLFKKTKKLSYLLMKIRLLEWNSEFDKARKLLKNIEKMPELTEQEKAEVHKLFGYLYLWQNAEDKALQYFKMAQRENPDDEEIKEEIMLLTGNFKPVLKKYLNLIKKEPKPYYYRRIGDIYLKIGKYKKALKYYLKYSELNPEDINVFRDIGEIYIKLGNYQKGFSYLEFYANKINTSKAKLILAKNYYWAGFPKAALQVLEEIIKTDPNNRKAINLKAKILSETPRFKMEQQSVETTGKNTEIEKWKELAERLENGGFIKEAAKAYEKYLTFYPEDPKAIYGLAKTLEILGNYEEAAAEWFLLSWYRNDIEVLFHYGRCLANSGKKEEAKKILKRIVALQPPETILAFLNQWKKAWEEKNFEKYVSFYAKSVKTPYWIWKKKNLFRENSYIKVNISNIELKSKADNKYKIQFWQQYSSPTHSDEGLKTLVLEEIAPKKFLIVKETWQKAQKKYDLDKIIGEAKRLLKTIENQKSKTRENATHKISEKNNPKIEQQKIELDEKLIDRFSLKLSLLDNLTLNIPEVPTGKIGQQEKQESEKIKGQFYGNSLFDSNSVSFFTAGYRLAKDNLSGRIEGYYLKNNGTFTGFEVSGKIINSTFWYGLTIDISNYYKNIYPFITYFNKENGLTVSLLQESIAKERLSTTAAEKNRIGTFVKGTLYRKASNKELWGEIKTGYINDGNISTIFQFLLADSKNSISPVLKGWYMADSKETEEYYSPHFFDSTLIGLKKTILYGGLKIEPEVDVGYSFKEKLMLGEITLKARQKRWNAKLTFSNLRVTTLSESRYWYLTCEVMVNGF
ncbi:tetratricopeptide repeat protein [Desulfurobacterium sp. TC5-1]|uniref:tetratricopeptide repeat protein n=1 Tax=Desulfurobacterium sp. TC5-1 TaxID=1158318 RepID=UPI0003B5B4D3|nr:tetratricopeptide repeat protein [Desulfurobacterium sp. TC5-1]